MSLPQYILSNAFGTINLNDHVNWFIDDDAGGVDLGNMQTTWDEAVSIYGGPNAQVNVKRGSLVPVNCPMWCDAASQTDMDTKLAALWAIVDAAGTVATTLQTDTQTFNIGYSTRPASIPRTNLFLLNFHAEFTLVLTRQP